MIIVYHVTLLSSWPYVVFHFFERLIKVLRLLCDCQLQKLEGKIDTLLDLDTYF